MANEVFNLAILLSLKDKASGGLDHFRAKLLAAGKDGENFTRSIERIRSEMNKGIGMATTGLAGLALMGKGIKVAGDFQASITDLKNSFSEVGKDGRVNMTALIDSMKEAETLSMRLGNALPGTTEDFVQELQVLKQNGLDIKTILNGAGEAVANLAVATHAIPSDVAADFAKFGNLFKLQGSEFIPAADAFARIYTSTGQTSAELIEAAKYFQGRTGATLGVKGLEDAKEYIRLFGFMGKMGMSGSMAGMGLTDFFDEYAQHADKLKDLEAATGIKLDFFDKAGNSVGLEKIIEQMAQFNKLTEKDKSQWMQQLFGTLGKGAGNILANADGWKQFNAEQDKTIGMAEQNANISKNFNNQLEALQGTVKNLVVTGFGPLLPEVTKAVSSFNDLVSSVQEFAKAHPNLTGLVAKLALLGTTALTAVGGVKALWNGIQMFRMAKNFTSEEKLISFFQKVGAGAQTSSQTVEQTAANLANNYGRSAARVNESSKSMSKGFAAYAAADRKLQASLTETTRKLNTAQGGLSRFAGSWAGQTILVTLALEGASLVIEQLDKVMARQASVVENQKLLVGEWDSNFASLYNKPGDPKGRAGETAIAKQFLNSIDESGQLMTQLHPERLGWKDFGWYLTGGNPYGNSKWDDDKRFSQGNVVDFGPATAARRWQSQGLGMVTRDPNVLAAVVRQLNMQAGEKGMTTRDVEMITAAIERMAGPEKWAATTTVLAKEGFAKPVDHTALPFNIFTGKGNTFTPNPALNFGPSLKSGALDQTFSTLQGTTSSASDELSKLAEKSKPVPDSFFRLKDSASGASGALDNLSSKLSSWTPPSLSAPLGPDGQPTLAAPANATGGIIERDGWAYLHQGNTITPARKKAYEGTSGSVTIHAPLNVTINGADRQSAMSFQKQLDDHARLLERQMTRILANGRIRA